MRLIRICILAGLVWPVVQLVPLPEPILRWMAPERAAELARFAAAGVTVSPTLSLYPYATLRMLALLAGLGGLYLLARQFRQRANWVLALIVLAGLAEVAISLRQHLLGQAGLAPLTEPRGTFGNRNVLAAWLVGCYGAALALPGGWPAAVVLAVATVMTMSRAGIAAVGFATVLFAVTTRRRRALLIAGLGVALAATTGLTARFGPKVLRLEGEGRVAMWADSLRVLGRYGLAGAGAGAFPYAFRRSHGYLGAYTIDHPHNDYLEILVEWGVPAGLFLIGGLAAWLVQRLRRPGCLAGVAGIALHALVDFPLHIPAVAGLVAVLAGVSDPGPRRRLAWLIPAALLLALPLSMSPTQSSEERDAAPALAPAAPGLVSAPAGRRSEGRDESRPGRLKPALRVFGAGVPPAISQWNAEAHYRAGAYQKGLMANPYAAPLWMELAWQAEARGEREAARRYAGMALEVEPHTHRTMWRAANLYLRLGYTEPGRQLLDQLAREAPDLTPAIALARRLAAPH